MRSRRAAVRRTRRGASIGDPPRRCFAIAASATPRSRSDPFRDEGRERGRLTADITPGDLDPHRPDFDCRARPGVRACHSRRAGPHGRAAGRGRPHRRRARPAPRYGRLPARDAVLDRSVHRARDAPHRQRRRSRGHHHAVGWRSRGRPVPAARCRLAALDDRVEFAPRGVVRDHAPQCGWAQSVPLPRSRASRCAAAGRPEGRLWVSRISRQRHLPRAPGVPIEYRSARRPDVRAGRAHGFNFVRQGANAEVLRAFSRRVSLSARYLLDFTRLFDEQYDQRDQPLIDRAFPEVRLSRLASGVTDGSARQPGDRRHAGRSSQGTSNWRRGDRVRGRLREDVPSGLGLPASRCASAEPFLAGQVQLGAARGFPRVRRSCRPNDGDRGRDDRRGSARQPALLRRRQHERAWFPSRPTGRAGVAQRRRVAARAATPCSCSTRRCGASWARCFGRNVGAVGFVDTGNVFKRAGDLRLTDLQTHGGRWRALRHAVRRRCGSTSASRCGPPTANGQRQRGWEYHLNIGEAF